VVAEGSAKAAARGAGKCKGRDLISAGQRLRVTLKDNEIRWMPKIERISGASPSEVAIAAPAVARPGDLKVDFDGDLTAPLDEVVGW